MTQDEFKQKHPELYNQVTTEAQVGIQAAARTEAIATERARIQAIEEIAPAIGDPALVNDAKYGEAPCTAEELALKAMKKQASLGAQHLNNTAADFENSGAAKVGAAPNTGTDNQTEADVAAINAVVGAYLTTKGGVKK